MKAPRPGVGAAPSRRSGEAGFSLVELLVSAAASGVLLTAVCALIVAQARAIGLHLDRGRVAEALRVPALVATGELALLVPSLDVREVTEESISLRAFRGVGLPCAVGGQDVLVRYSGLRQPEPEKDSVLAVGAGAEEALRLAWSGGGGGPGCEPGEGERILRWRLGSELPPGAVLLLFETGSYHLAASAFRYRRGAAGRQPLTEPILDASGSGFRLLDLGTGSPRAVEVLLAARLDANRPLHRAERVVIPLLNAPP